MRRSALKNMLTAISTVIVAIATVACAGDTGSPSATEDVPPTPTATPGPDVARCTNDEGGYTVGYPHGWHTNDGSVAPACTYFDPEPVALAEGTEPDTAIAFEVSDVAFARASSEGSFGRVRSRDEATIDGRDAAAIVHEATGDGLREEGTVSYVWVVDRGDGSLIAATYDTSGRDFRANMDVLDLMISNLEFTPDT